MLLGATFHASSLDDLSGQAVEQRCDDRIQVGRAGRERTDAVSASIAPDVAEAGLDDPGDLQEQPALGDLAVPLAPGPRPEAARIDRVIR
jgi:hypothetical protein